MKNTNDIIWRTIARSAKLRFDYKSFEAVFSEFDDDNIAENVLLKIIAELAAGKSEKCLVDQINHEMLLLGFSFEEHYLKKLLEHKKEELKTEIHVTLFAHAMLEQGSNPITILNAVSKMLN